jgi:hypothetical protein
MDHFLPYIRFERVADPVDAEQQRVERVLEQGLERVQTPEAARAVISRVERLSRGKTEEQSGQIAVHPAAPSETDKERAAATTIEHAAERRTPESAVAAALTTTAAETVAPTPAAPKMVEAAQAALTPHAHVSPEAERGRRLLKEATLQRMGPLQALDARIYLAINEAPHPGWLDSLAWVLAWMVEYPIKAYFRRRRPFVEIVRALVIGKKPGSWSFPSGHTAASFASAWVLSTVWPRRSPVFASVAALVGLSRIYVGAHYPGDVASGAIAGTVLSELIRRAVKRVL